MKKKVVEKRITIKEKEMREHNRGREWVAEREREREECVERQTVGFVSTEQFFSPVNRLISFMEGDHRKKQEENLQIVFKPAFGQLLMCHFFFICESYRLDELILVYLFWWLDRTILSIEIRHSRALRHKFDKKPNQSKNESHKYY